MEIKIYDNTVSYTKGDIVLAINENKEVVTKNKVETVNTTYTAKLFYAVFDIREGQSPSCKNSMWKEIELSVPQNIEIDEDLIAEQIGKAVNKVSNLKPINEKIESLEKELEDMRLFLQTFTSPKEVAPTMSASVTYQDSK